METSKLKTFAQSARRQLLEQVAVRLEQVLRADSIETREKKAAISELRNQIAQSGKPAVIDRAAYTWFNRFCALRFMDANHYTRIGIVSPVEGYTQPEILQEAKQGVIEGELKVDRPRVLDILSGRLPSPDPQGEAYRLLLVGACNTYNQQMPFLFEKIADPTELLLPDDLLSESSVLHQLRQALTEEVCQDVEAIGWLYQFYISERKDEVFANLKEGRKIEAKDIPAATQLFTPHWIVRYLVENSLGRLWMLNHPDSKLVEQMDYYIKPEQEETDFLKIAAPEEIKVCDPACGSGHMLTYAFDLLYAIYAEQGYDPAGIPGLILQKNLYGIEIDKRAGDLAAFALVMKARAKDRRFFSRGVEPNICVLQNVCFTAEEINEYMNAVGNDLFTQDLWATLKQFEQADNIGSLIRPQLKDVSFLRNRLNEKRVFENLLHFKTNQNIQLVLKQAEYLSSIYHVVVTNPPYMGTNGMNNKLNIFGKNEYPISKTNTFSMFIERCLDLSVSRGLLGLITLQSWMFLPRLENMRLQILNESSIISMAHLGTRGFDTISGEIVSTSAFVLKNSFEIPELNGIFIRLVEGKNEKEKQDIYLQSIRNPNETNVFRVKPSEFKKVPGAPIAYWIGDRLREIFTEGFFLEKIAEPRAGLQTGDNEKFLRYWHEITFTKIGFGFESRDKARRSGKKWFPYNKGGGFRKWNGIKDYVVNWENDGDDIRRDKLDRLERGLILPSNSKPKNVQYYFKEALTWTVTGSAIFSIRYSEKGFLFDIKGSSCFCQSDLMMLLLGFLGSKVVGVILQALNPTIDFQNGNIKTLPLTSGLMENTFIEQVDVICEKLIYIARTDWDAFETSWDFTQSPLIMRKQVGNLILAYNTLRKRDNQNILEMQQLETSNNIMFIEAYGLENEVTPEIPLNEITLSCNPYYRYSLDKDIEDLEALLLSDTIKEFISYAVGCMFGRYSLDKPGLILANQGERAADYYRQVPQPSFPPEDDNVLPILEAGWFSDDITERFKRFLKVTFGEEHFEENLSFIENAIGARDIRGYFLKDFYNEHVKMYKSRPIYWLFSSPSGAFNALIYMHRYRPDTVSVVLNDYLRQYIRKLQAHKAHLEQVGLRMGGSQAEKTKATKEINALNKTLAELKEYEDEVLYPLATRQLQIDLDDGVRVNYKKFGKALKRVKGLSE